METRNDANPLFPIVIGAAFCLLIGAGIWSIIQADTMYDQSYKQSIEFTQKLLDTSYKKAITAPIPAPNYAVVKEGYSGALLYFTLGLGALLIMLLLPRLQNVSISPTGGINLTLRDIQQNVDTLIKQTNTIESSSVGEGGKKPSAVALSRGATRSAAAPAPEEDDPQKGRWGGSPETNGRRLHADVTETPVPGYYQVVLTVESTDANKPLTGLVTFHLHHTFHNPNPVIAVADGKAVLKLTRVYGAFTAGADADNGATKLELDLAELPNAPKAFKEH